MTATDNYQNTHFIQGLKKYSNIFYDPTISVPTSKVQDLKSPQYMYSMY
jgi:hypothetical protein